MDRQCVLRCRGRNQTPYSHMFSVTCKCKILLKSVHFVKSPTWWIFGFGSQTLMKTSTTLNNRWAPNKYTFKVNRLNILRFCSCVILCTELMKRSIESRICNWEAKIIYTLFSESYCDLIDKYLRTAFEYAAFSVNFIASLAHR